MSEVNAEEAQEIAAKVDARLDQAMDEVKAWAEKQGLTVHMSMAAMCVHVHEWEAKDVESPDLTCIEMQMEDRPREEMKVSEGVRVMGHFANRFGVMTGVPVAMPVELPPEIAQVIATASAEAAQSADAPAAAWTPPMGQA